MQEFPLGPATGERQPTFAYALSKQPDHTSTVTADGPLPAGNNIVHIKFGYESGGIDKAAAGT
jgi:hypothetical protein